MIVVAGFNTAIDRRIELAGPLLPGAVQRVLAAQAEPGGKGVHVARMIAELGEAVQLVGLVDAAHREWLAGHLRGCGVDWRPVESPFALRQCLALQGPDADSTEILEPGPALPQAVCLHLLDTVTDRLDSADALVVSGSLPNGCADDTYAQLVHQARQLGKPCLVDSSGEALWQAIDARPWLVKPNADEAATLLGRPLENMADAVACLELLLQHDVRRAVVTLGARGAVAGDGVEMWHVRCEQAEVRNSVGSGDCFLAALAVGATGGQAFPESLRLAAACAAANLGNVESGQASRAQVQACLQHAEVRPLRVSGGCWHAD